jgi:hypothetical protein
LTTAAKTKALPLGTTPATAKLHRRIQNCCYVLLVGLVLEGSLMVPLTLAWYGWPTLSVHEICDELNKVIYSDPNYHCKTGYPLTTAPYGDAPAGANQKTTKDKGIVQPTPDYPRIGFRDLVRIHNERVAAQGHQK